MKLLVLLLLLTIQLNKEQKHLKRKVSVKGTLTYSKHHVFCIKVHYTNTIPYFIPYDCLFVSYYCTSNPSML